MTRKILLVLLLFIALTIQAQQPHWVGTWACAPQTVDKSFMPYNNQMTNRSVRQVVKVSIGGNVIRLQLSNELRRDYECLYRESGKWARDIQDFSEVSTVW